MAGLTKRDGNIPERLHGLKHSLGVFFSFLWNNIIHDRIFLSAASLSYQTLLSLVPLMAVILSILNAFPLFMPLRLYIEDFMFQSFVPAQGALLKGYLWQFIGNTSTVPVLGGVFLFTIALFLFSTIDHTLNEIWEVHAPRKPLEGFTLYWTVLTLGPILIGTGLAAGSYAWYMVFTHGALLEMKTRILAFIPFINSVAVLFLLYMLVPNRKVRFLHAFSGALIAAVLFELAKKWFTFYVTSFATFEHIYGALSVIPMLFFWVYLEWVVVLTGAEIVYCLGAIRPVREAQADFDPLLGVPEILYVLRHVWSGQKTGAFMNMKKLLSADNSIERSTLHRIVDFLVLNDIIHLTASGELALSGDLHSLTLYDLYAKLPPELIRAEKGTEPVEGEDALGEVRQSVLQSLMTRMDVPLIMFVQDSKPKSS